MRTIDVNVSERTLTLSERSILQGGVNEDRLKVTLDDEWSGMAVTAYFVGSDTAKAVIMGSDGYVTVPWETIEKTGRLGISFVGKGSDTTLTTHSEGAWLTIQPCGAKDGTSSADPTQDLFTQLQTSMVSLQTQLTQLQEALAKKQDSTGVYLQMGADSDGNTTPQVVVE